MTKTKFEVMDACNPLDIPVGPILSMKEISEDDGLYATGTLVRSIILSAVNISRLGVR